MPEIVQIPEIGLALPPAEVYSGQWAHNKTWAGLCPWKGEGVRIAVLDTGCSILHPALIGSVVGTHNQVSPGDPVTDTVGHGTRVAGMAAGLTSIAPEAELFIIKISEASDGSANTGVIANAILTAYEAGCMVVNISYDISSSQIVRDAAADYASWGGVVVCAGGNSGQSHSHPADPNILSIGATDQWDNYPPWSETGLHIDLFAPGAGVFTTTNTSGYDMAYGTSFSSPFVAAVCAIIKEIRPEYHATEVAGCLRRWLNKARRVNVARAAYAAKLNVPLLET